MKKIQSSQYTERIREEILCSVKALEEGITKIRYLPKVVIKGKFQ
jgi:hypothetical protein